VEITATSLSLPADMNDDSVYQHLNIVRSIFSPCLSKRGICHLPGGADPMIQYLSPLVITSDRLLDGEIIINPPRAGHRDPRGMNFACSAMQTLLPGLDENVI